MWFHHERGTPVSVQVMVEIIEGAMQTPDGAWRVEAVRRGRSRWYRIVHGDEVTDLLPIASVQRILTDAGVDMGALVETRPATG